MLSIKSISSGLFIASVFVILVLWFLLRSYQYLLAEQLDFSKDMAFQYIKLIEEHSTGECSTTPWLTLEPQELSLETKQAELARSLVNEYTERLFGSKHNSYQLENSSTSPRVVRGYVVLLLQISAMALSFFATKANWRPAYSDWNQLFEDCFPVWSSIPVFLYLWRRCFARQRNSTFNERLWYLSGTGIMLFFGLRAALAVFQSGPVRGFLQIIQVIISYEATSIVFTSVFGGTLSMLGGGTPRKLAQLRNKPRLAVLFAIQLPLWFLCEDVLPGTVTATLCLLLLSGDEPEYLAKYFIDNLQYQESSFCQACSDVVIPVLRDSKDIESTPHHTTSKSLFEAVKRGCRICSAVWELRTRTPKDVWGTLMFWKPVTTFRNSGAFFYICFAENQEYQCRFELYKTEGKFPLLDTFSTNISIAKQFKGTPLLDYFQHKGLSNHTGSVESLQQASKWLLSCTQEHGCSAPSDPTNFLPTRLLYLGRLPKKRQLVLEDYQPPALQIHTKNEFSGRKISYTTLSHCWGGQDYVKLLSSNLCDFRSQISYSSLPTTFRHAIFITQLLGFEYIWIDSLCIIQDSRVDWSSEAEKMGSVYRHSQCNIAAADAANSEIGCLYPRKMRTIKPEVVRFENDLRSEIRVLINSTDLYGDHVLYTRAWVLQEGMLAPRTLDCGKGQLFWRCGYLTASELFPRGVPPDTYCADHPASVLRDSYIPENYELITNIRIIETFLYEESVMGLHSGAPNQRSVGDLLPKSFNAWANLVEKFTKMKLTQANDRMVALTGVTNVFRPFLNEHFAGLWRTFLPFELLWHVEEKTCRADPHRAPTWSWQSLDCKISYSKCRFDRSQGEVYTELLEIHPKFTLDEGKDTIALRLQGPLLNITWTGWLGPEIKTHSAYKIKSVVGQVNTVGILGIPLSYQPFGEIYFDVLAGPEPPKELSCLPILHIESPEDATFSGPRDRGLVLERKAGYTYHRLGYFEGFDDVGFTEIIANTNSQEVVLV
jgi:hypothetical protein